MSHEAPRVGIVLVSHSARLAEGAADLASQVSGGTVRVLAAGGTEDGELGTSAEKIAQAVAGAEAGAGVLVLPDLGSAVLTVLAMLADAGLADTGLADTGLAEAGLADTELAETGIADAGLADTGLADTGLADTGLAETGRAGTGPAGTGGTSTGPASAEGLAGMKGPAGTGGLAGAGGLADTPGARVVLADAPFVEGAVAATVTAAAGADLRTVAAAAEEAWHARKL